MIIGIIPGPSEPSMNINTYLRPLIDDLQALWAGVTININGKKKTIRAAISCLACDVPAARKVGGFIGYNGRYGCNRCFKEFVVENFGDYPDYSGFVKSDWEVRSHAIHVWYALKLELSKKKSLLNHVLEHVILFYMSYHYYHSINSCVIDPMHCLFLGIAKTFFKTWLAHNILTEDKFPLIQEKVNALPI